MTQDEIYAFLDDLPTDASESDEEELENDDIDPSNNCTVTRRNRDGSVEDVSCLLICNLYNKYMGYVDKFYMLLSLYQIDKKFHKWWHKIFWYFLDASIVNAYVVFRTRCPNKGS